MSQDDRPRLSYHGSRLLSRLSPGIALCGRCDQTQECIDAGGMLFWLEPIGKKAGAASARELIAKGYVVPQKDALFEDGSQTWRAP